MPGPILLLLIISLLFSQGAQVSQTSPSPAYENDEAYEVYSAILPTEWIVTDTKAKRLIIRTETKGYEMCLRPEKESEEIIGSAIAEYVKLNAHPQHLQQKFNVDLPYNLITGDDIKAAFDQAGWDGFYQWYPDSHGWIELSAVGFNAGKTVAVVYMGHHSGLRCGEGRFYVLQKKDGKWVPLEWKGESCVWDS